MNRVTFFKYHNSGSVAWYTVSVNSVFQTNYSIKDSGDSVSVIKNGRVLAVTESLQAAQEFVSTIFNPVKGLT